MRRILSALIVTGLATAGAGAVALTPAYAATAGYQGDYQVGATPVTNATATVGFNGTSVEVNVEPPPGAYALNGVPGITAASPSSSTTNAPDPITVTGVVQEGVEAGCLLLVPDLSNQPPFLLLGGDRGVLVPGARVRVVGVPENTAGWCMQGQPLRVLSAHPAST